MRILNNFLKYGVAATCLVVLAGCAGTRTVDEKTATEYLEQSDYRGYAASFLKADGTPSYDPSSLLDTLEAGKSFNDAGMWELSREAFDHASKHLSWKEDTIDTPKEVVNLLGTTLTSDAFGAYQGKIHQGVLIDYYQAINHLMIGNEANSRVDFNRLEVRQGNAVTQLNAYAETINQSVKEGLSDEESLSSRESLAEVGPKVADGIKNLPSGLTKAKIRVAAGDVMGALFRATSSAKSDKNPNMARNMLKHASESSSTRGGDAMIAYLGREISQGKGALKNKVIIIYEDGLGPSLEEFRIDLPLFIVTDKVTYTGIALPQFNLGRPAFGSLNIGEGKKAGETATLTNINELVGLEFDVAYKGIVAKAVISTVIKTAAQAVINHQIDQEANPLIGAILKIGVGATQYALTKADTRSWVNLPNTIQMAVVDAPKDGVLPIKSGAGLHIANLEVDPAVNTLVLIKAAGSMGSPAIYQQVLPAEVIASASNLPDSQVDL